MCFARFNLFANSYIFMLTKWPARASPLFKLRLLEFAGIIGFWTWFGLVVRGVEGIGSKIAFVLVSFAVTSPLHVQVSKFLVAPSRIILILCRVPCTTRLSYPTSLNPFQLHLI